MPVGTCVGVCWPNTMPRILASLCPFLQQLELSCPLLTFQPAKQFPVVWRLNFLGHFRLELWRNGFKPSLLLFSVQWWERNKSDSTSLTPQNETSNTVCGRKLEQGNQAQVGLRRYSYTCSFRRTNQDRSREGRSDTQTPKPLDLPAGETDCAGRT